MLSLDNRVCCTDDDDDDDDDDDAAAAAAAVFTSTVPRAHVHVVGMLLFMFLT